MRWMRFEDNWRNSNYDISGQKLDINAYGEVGLGMRVRSITA